LFGLSPVDLLRAAAHYADSQRTIRFGDSARLLDDLG
jgi:hypothetical protein